MGLNWISFDWIGLPKLDCIGSDWIGLLLIGFDWIGGIGCF
jgi:hypothetical protein